MMIPRIEGDETVSCVGIDVGKHVCVAAVRGRRGSLRFAPDAAGVAQLLGHLRGVAGKVRVGLEASGGYEAALWEALAEAGVDVRQLSPSRVRAYARSVGRNAKTDAGDAAMIAEYMAANPEAGRRLPAETVREIRALSAKRRQVIEMRKALACQSQQNRHPTVREMDDELMARLQDQIARLDAAIARRIAEDPGLAAKRRLLISIPGLGEVATATLIAEMPELGQLRPGAAAALAGLAPFNRDSGTASGHRFIQGGRGVIRNVLYMAAISASAHAPSLKPFADSLKARGKPGKQVLIAVGRKLIELANLVLARQSPWVPR